MRFGLYALALLVVVGGYFYALISSPVRSYVDPDKVDPASLAKVLRPEALPDGFALVSEQHGFENWRPSGRGAYGAQLFENAEGERIAIQVIVMGSRWANGNLRTSDALCGREWPGSECDGQFNTYRYEDAYPALYGNSASTQASMRTSTSGARVRNDTFVLAGMRITVSTLAHDETSRGSELLQTNQSIVAELYAGAIALADDQGVDVRDSLTAKR